MTPPFKFLNRKASLDDRTVSPLAIDVPASDHPVAPPTVPLMDKLVQGVHAAYEADKTNFANELNSGKPWKISVGEWDAFVRDNGDCLLRAQVGESKQTICRFNLQTGEVAMPLKAEQAEELERMMEQSQQQSSLDFFKNKQKWENGKGNVTSTNHGSKLLQPDFASS